MKKKMIIFLGLFIAWEIFDLTIVRSSISLIEANKQTFITDFISFCDLVYPIFSIVFVCYVLTTYNNITINDCILSDIFVVILILFQWMGFKNGILPFSYPEAIAYEGELIKIFLVTSVILISKIIRKKSAIL